MSAPKDLRNAFQSHQIIKIRIPLLGTQRIAVIASSLIIIGYGKMSLTYKFASPILIPCKSKFLLIQDHSLDGKTGGGTFYLTLNCRTTVLSEENTCPVPGGGKKCPRLNCERPGGYGGGFLPRRRRGHHQSSRPADRYTAETNSALNCGRRELGWMVLLYLRRPYGLIERLSR